MVEFAKLSARFPLKWGITRGRGPLVQRIARLLLLGFALAAGACAYTEYRPTLERYRQIGSGAELRGDMAAAEQAYAQALQITREGQLGDQLEMVNLYELGRVKRNLGKLAESEQLLQQSLQLDARLSAAYGRPWGAPTGYILAELAATYLEAGKLADGIAVLDRLEPIAGQYKDKITERTFIRQVFTRYARALAARGDEPGSRRFAAVADSL
jgi:tetratricopeptide (TPR) repeat protein